MALLQLVKDLFNVEVESVQSYPAYGTLSIINLLSFTKSSENRREISEKMALYVTLCLEILDKKTAKCSKTSKTYSFEAKSK